MFTCDVHTSQIVMCVHYKEHVAGHDTMSWWGTTLMHVGPLAPAESMVQS